MPHLAPGIARCVTGVRNGSLAQHQQGGQAGQHEDRSGDQHRHRDEVGGAVPLSLCPADPRQTGSQRNQPADIAECPAPSGDAAECAWPSQFGQEGRDQVLAGTEEVVGQHQRHDRQRQGTRRREIQRRGEADAAERGQPQQAFLARMGVGPGADQRRSQHHQPIGNRQGKGPGEGRPRRLGSDHADEIRTEHRGDDDRGVAGVGEVVHRPGPHFASLDAGSKQDFHLKNGMRSRMLKNGCRNNRGTVDCWIMQMLIGFVRQIRSPRVIDTRPDTGSKKDVQQFIPLSQIPSEEFGQLVSPRHIFILGKQRRTHSRPALPTQASGHHRTRRILPQASGKTMFISITAGGVSMLMVAKMQSQARLWASVPIGGLVGRDWRPWSVKRLSRGKTTSSGCRPKPPATIQTKRICHAPHTCRRITQRLRNADLVY